MEIKQLDNNYVAHTYNRFPVEIVSGKGSVAYDSAGRRYIDMGSGIGVTSFGMADEVWIRAVTEQLGKVQHTSNLYYTAPCALLARMLCERTGMKKVFFGNSGAEANECAIKAARKYAADTYGPGRYTILTLVNSFHGRTLTTLAATGQERFHALYRPLTPGFAYAPAGDLDRIKELHQESPLAGILIECVQGEGGVLPLDPAFVKALAAFASEQDILLMVDEVQTGNGRSGMLYAYQHYGITPDVVTTAKGLAGGLPLGCCLLGGKAENVFSPGDHGSTFGGNPVACAGALSVLERINDSLLSEVRAKSRYLFDLFTGADGIEAVTGLGLMIGLKTVRPAGEVIRACMEKGVLCLSAKDRVRLLPALNIPMEQLQEAAGILLGVCQS